MAKVSTYLDFPRNTEAAFTFYKPVFGTEFSTPIGRFRDIPPQPHQLRLHAGLQYERGHRNGSGYPGSHE